MTSNDTAPGVMFTGGLNEKDLIALSSPDVTPADYHGNADPLWRDCAERALTYLAGTRSTFTVYDLIELGVPDPDVPNRWGCLMSHAKRAGLVEVAGYDKPHGMPRPVTMWRGVAA